MKKVWLKFLPLTLAFSLLLSACGGTASSASPTSAGAASASPSATTSAEPIVIKFACTQSDSDLMAIHMQEMIDEITEKTNGGITCEFYPNGQLGTLNDILEMQLQGANIVCSNGLESMTDYVKDIGAVAGPFLFKTYDEIPVLINSDWMNEIESNCRDYGVMGLSYNWITGFRSFIGNTIIEEPEDFKGLQLRAANTTLMGLIMKSLGATHLISNWNEVYTGLSNGTYDGVEADLPLLYSSNLYEVCKYLNLTQQHVNVCAMWISSEFFDSLPAEYQTIMQDAAQTAGVAFSKDCYDKTQTVLEEFKAKGVEVHEVDHDAMVAATKSVWDEYPQFSAGIYDKLRAIIDAGIASK